MNMDFHPIANVWPLMDDDKLSELAEDIRVNGLINPIWTYEGKVLDGRNRYKACLLASVKPTFTDYTGDSPASFAVSLNDHRRHMNKGALGAVAVELLPHFEEEARLAKVKAGKEFGRGQEKKVPQKVGEPIKPIVNKHESEAVHAAAKAVGTNRQYVADAKKIKAADPDTFERLKAGKVTMQNAKREVSKKPTDDWRKDERDRQKQVNAGVSVTANQSNDKNLILWAEQNGKAVRIDRSSKYGNPFILGQDGNRDDVCDKFEKHYLPHKPSILTDTLKLKGKVLICHCYPERCHGECLCCLANQAFAEVAS
jgi:ParB-like chromosome segregation protein Spo0J